MGRDQPRKKGKTIMTTREFLTAITEGTMNEEIITHATEALAKLDNANKKKANSSQSKKAKENAPIINGIIECLKGSETPMTSPDIATAITTEDLPVTHNKVSALCRQLVAAGRLTVTDVKVPKRGVMKAYGVVSE